MTTSAAGPAERRDARWFLLALLALCAVWLGRALVGEVFVSTEMIHRSVQPWSGLEPAPPPVHNENLADQPTVWLPMQAASRAMVRDWLLHGGEPPLWCPQSYAGAPWLGNLSSALFSPFTWLFVLLPFAPAFAICAAAKWLLAGIGTWCLARRLGIGPAGRALAGIVYAFCGFQVVWIDSCLTNVSVWAPWLLLAIERALERPAPGRTAVLALVSWQVLVGGHPETSFWVGVGAAVYAACRWLALERGRGAALLALCGGAAIGGLLAVVQWWPFLEYALHSFGREQREQLPDLHRAGGWPTAWKWLAVAIAAAALVRARRPAPEQGPAVMSVGRAIAFVVVAAACFVTGSLLRECGLRPTVLLELLPDYYGRSLDGGSYGGPLTYNDVTAGFCGAAVAVLAASAALLRLRDGRVVAIALAALVVSLRFFRVPGLSELLGRVPLAGDFGTSRALGFLALGVALLAGFAVEELRERPRRLAGVAVAVLLLAAGVGLTRDVAVADWGGAATPIEGGELRLPESLVDPGGSGLGAEIRGFAPPGTEQVRLRVNGREQALLMPAEPEVDGRLPFSWRWLGSHRLEEGSYQIEAETVRADGSAAVFDREAVLAERPPRPSGRWAVHLGALAAVLLAALLLSSARARIAVLGVAAVVELAFFGTRYNDTTPRDRLPGGVDPIPFLEAKRRELGPFRVFTARTHLHPNLHLLFDVDVLRGYDALEPVDYVHVLDWLRREPRAWVELDFTTVDFAGYPGAQLADLMNVRFALSEEPAPAGWREVWRQQPARASAAPLILYENPDALPRAYTVQRAVEAVAAYERREDLRPVAAWDAPPLQAFPGSARVLALDHARGRMRVTVESDAGTILVVSENAAGWRATIDGEPAELRRTHGTFLSVIVPSGGRHEVDLVYRPPSVTRGAAISACGLALLLGLVLVGRRRAASSRHRLV